MLRSLLKYHGDKTETIFRAWSETWLSKWFADWNIENLLPDIQAPLLIIQGADDQYGTKDQVHSIVSKSSGYVRDEIVEKCGHAPHLESQTIVLEIMSDFISQIK
jgi:pimeloyl-ACP methyl ester carboxylesterase